MVCGDVCKGEDVQRRLPVSQHTEASSLSCSLETAAPGAGEMTDPPQSISYEFLKSSFGGFPFCDILQNPREAVTPHF